SHFPCIAPLPARRAGLSVRPLALPRPAAAKARASIPLLLSPSYSVRSRPTPPASRPQDLPVPICVRDRCNRATECIRSAANKDRRRPSAAPVARACTSTRCAHPPEQHPSRRASFQIATLRDAPSLHSDWPALVPSALLDPVGPHRHDPHRRRASRGSRFHSCWVAAQQAPLLFRAVSN